MTNPLRTKNRSTPSAPAVTSGPSTSTAAATPSRPVKWKWNSTTQAAATIRSPVSARNSAGRGATWSPERVVRGEGGVVIVTIGATRGGRYARRVTFELYPDARPAHGAWRRSCDERVTNVAATRPNDAARDDGRLPAVDVEHALQRFPRRRPERLAGVVGRREQDALPHVRRDAEQLGDLAARSSGAASSTPYPGRGRGRRAGSSRRPAAGSPTARPGSPRAAPRRPRCRPAPAREPRPCGRRGGPSSSPTRCWVARRSRVVRPGVAPRAAVGVVGALVVPGDAGTQLRVGDHQPVPALPVAARSAPAAPPPGTPSPARAGRAGSGRGACGPSGWW